MLNVVNLSNNQITDISQMDSLTVQVFRLNYNPNIQTIGALQTLLSLDEIYLQNTSVDDISALANNAALTGASDVVNVEYSNLDDLDLLDVDTLLGRGVQVDHTIPAAPPPP